MPVGFAVGVAVSLESGQQRALVYTAFQHGAPFVAVSVLQQPTGPWWHHGRLVYVSSVLGTMAD